MYKRLLGAPSSTFSHWFPRPLRPLVRRAIVALLDEPVRVACGFAPVSPLLRYLVQAPLRLRARVLRVLQLLPRRRKPRLRTAIGHRSYPAGYRVETLGPPPV